MKKTIAIILALVMVLALAACGTTEQASSTAPEAEPAEATSPEVEASEANDATSDNVTAFDAFIHPTVKPNGDLKVGFLHNPTANEDTARMVAQVEIECEHRGWSFVDGEYEGGTYFRDAWETMLNQDVDAIIIGVADNFETYADLVAESRERGIGIYCCDNTPIEGVLCNTFIPLGVCTSEMMYAIGADYNWDFDFCLMSVDAVASHYERMCVIEALAEAFPNVNELARDGSPILGESALLGYDIAQAWIQQFGSDLDVIFTSFQMIGLNTAEAIIQNGDANGDNTIVAFVDQGPSSWAYLRENTPVKYVYATPFELIYHTTCEVIDQIQVKGLNPGDEGCTLSVPAQQLYVDGTLLTVDNVPEVGRSIHSAFDYYDESDTDAWYFWQEEGGTQIAMITE